MSVTDFLSQFYPDPDEPIWLRSFDAKKIPNHLKGIAQMMETSINELRSDCDVQDKLKRINQTQGLYFVVNAGGNKNEHINRINAVYCEFDSEPEEADAHIVRHHDILDNESPLSPSIRLETRKGVHAYWLLADVVSVDEFCDLQHGLIKFFNSDKSIHNPSRVMRLPYFNHVRYDEDWIYQRITVHTFRPDWKHTLAELQNGFPYTRPKPVKEDWDGPSGRLETLDDVKAELRARIMAMKSWTVNGKWGCANGVCHNGEGDTGLRVDLASGAITCWSECTLKQILDAFGLELPNSRQFEYQPKRQQKSALHQWYQEQKTK